MNVSVYHGFGNKAYPASPTGGTSLSMMHTPSPSVLLPSPSRSPVWCVCLPCAVQVGQ
jgi:hypothetical protein